MNIPVAEDDNSLNATVDQDYYLEVVDGLFEPLGDYIKALRIGKLTFETIEWGSEEENNDDCEDDPVPDKDQLRWKEIAAMSQSDFMQLSVEERFEFRKNNYWDRASFLTEGFNRHGEEYTPDLLAYEEKVQALNEALNPIRDARRHARAAKNDSLELSLSQEIISKLNSFTPLKKFALDSSQMDYYVNRASMIQMRQGRIEDVVSTISSYYAGPFCGEGDHVTAYLQDAIQKRFNRAQKMLKRG